MEQIIREKTNKENFQGHKKDIFLQAFCAMKRVKSSKEFNRYIHSGVGIVVAQFTSTWCPYQLLPIERKYLVKKNRDVLFLQVDVDEKSLRKITEEYGVICTPTIVYFFYGIEMKKQTGLNFKRLRKSIRKLKKEGSCPTSSNSSSLNESDF